MLTGMYAPVVVLTLVAALAVTISQLRPKTVMRAGRASPSAPLLQAPGGDSGSAALAESAQFMHTPRTATGSTEFWLMWLVMTTVCGSNATTMNILSTIFTDRHAGSAVVSRIASILVMVCSSLTRFCCGYLIALNPAGHMSTFLVAGSASAAVAGQIFFTMDAGRSMLLVSCIAIGVSDGMFWGSLPIVSNRVFGLKNSGGIYGMLVCFGAVGFITLSLGVQPYVYQAHTKPGSQVCDEGVVSACTVAILTIMSSPREYLTDCL